MAYRPLRCLGLLLLVLWPATVLAQGYAVPAVAVPPGPWGNAAGMPLVPAQFDNRQDAMGFSWQFDPQGYARSNGQGSLNHAGMLMINGMNFSPSNFQMTPDGSEYVLNGNAGGVQLTRRVKFNAKDGSVRYVELFQNNGPAPMQVALQLRSSLRSLAVSVLSSPRATSLVTAPTVAPNRPGLRIRAAANFTGKLDPKDNGVVAVGQNQFPTVLFFLPSGRNAPAPDVQVQMGREFTFTYNLTIPPQKSVALMHGLAQRNLSATPTAKDVAKQFQVFQNRQWLSDLPKALCKSILNPGKIVSDSMAPAGPLLQAVLDLASNFQIDRGAPDVLVQDEQSQLPGTVSGNDLTIDTRFGKATVPLAQVALLAGGAGVDRPMRVYLRNGEVLSGPVESRDMVLKSRAGIQVKLLPPQINYLFFHAAAADGKPLSSLPPTLRAMVQTHLGERLAVVLQPGVKFQGATPWGMLDVGIEEIDRLYVQREPQPIYRVLLNDGTLLPVILRGDELALNTLRFGPIKLPSSSIVQLQTLKASANATDENNESPTELKVPHCRLVGESVLVGTIDVAKLDVMSPTGATEVDPGRLRSMERRDEVDTGTTFVMDLGDDNHLTGSLSQHAIPIRSHGRVWNIPAQHIVAYLQPKEEPAAEKPDSPATEPQEDRPPRAKAMEPQRARPPRVKPQAAPMAPPPERPSQPQLQSVPSDDPFAQ